MISLGPVAYLASKEKGDNSTPSTPALVPRRRDEETAGPCDKAKAELPEANLQMAQSDARRKDA